MDIFAHGLWTAASARAVNLKLEKRRKPKLNVLWATIWGIFPDLFAFSIPFLAIIFGLILGKFDLSNFSQRYHPGTTITPPVRETFWFLNVAGALYNISHSVVIFAFVFLIIWLIRKRPYWELLGWLLHILIDIPTHTTLFYPTPVFWPLSNWVFAHGISWGTRWFMVANYSSIAVAYFLLWWKYKKRATVR